MTSSLTFCGWLHLLRKPFFGCPHLRLTAIEWLHPPTCVRIPNVPTGSKWLGTPAIKFLLNPRVTWFGPRMTSCCQCNANFSIIFSVLFVLLILLFFFLLLAFQTAVRARGLQMGASCYNKPRMATFSLTTSERWKYCLPPIHVTRFCFALETGHGRGTALAMKS